jgi:hypothetical protein
MTTPNDQIFVRAASGGEQAAVLESAGGKHVCGPAPQTVTPTGLKDAAPAPQPFASIRKGR